MQAPPPRWQFVRFVVAAGLSVPVNIGSRILLSHFLPYEIAIVLSHICGMLVAYVLTRLFVFERSGRGTGSELGRFAVINVVSAAQTWLVAVGLVRLVFPAFAFETEPELVAHVVALALASATSFYGHRRYSFHKA